MSKVEESLKKLNPKNKLFVELEKNPPEWWKNLVDDKEVYIDIRRDKSKEYIDVYYNGGAIIRELIYKDNNFSGEINHKYILPSKSEYIKYNFNGNNISTKKDIINLIKTSKFEKDELRKIKDNIEDHYKNNSEKGIQAQFVNKTDYFLDTEFATPNNKERIDLIWVDTKNKKIIFVELKRKENPELFNEKGEETGIYKQLDKYKKFIEENEKEILDYYKKIFEIKKNLNILPNGLKKLESLEGYSLEKKPLLLIGNCSETWIKNNSAKIDEKIKDVAVGAYYFGSAKETSSGKRSCNLTKNNKYKHIF